MKRIDSLLNNITMYRLVTYGLAIMAIVSIVLGGFNILAMSPLSMLLSLALLSLSCFATEWALAKAWNRPFNHESWLITVLIIFLIFPSPKTLSESIVVLMVGVIANTSKYLLAWRGKHIFNPAAFAVASAGIANLQTPTWWVGNSVLWPFTLILGLLVVRKIKRFPMVITFITVSILLQTTTFVLDDAVQLSLLQSTLLASPLIFLATIMLTEPATMPARKKQQLIFAAITATLYSLSFTIGPIHIYPEIALLLANIYAFIVSPKFKTELRLQQIQRISDQVYNFVFTGSAPLAYKAGQYMEWTLPGVAFDERGNRRTFTIASSPTEDTLQVGVKFYNPSSAYKYTMSRMQPGDPIFVSQLAGDFTLDHRHNQKLAFIAGGIGVTPFRSMIKYITDHRIQCDIILLYTVSKPEELAYVKEFIAAKEFGVTLIPVLTNGDDAPGMVSGSIGHDLIRQVVPDYDRRFFYLSGPNKMVESTKTILSSMNVTSGNIKTDYFSGY